MARHSNKSAVPVTVIMRSNNSEPYIQHTLEALFSQSFQDFELILCDYSSTDRTREVEKKFPAKRYCVPAYTYAPGQVLNQLISNSRGEILVFLNADALIISRKSLWNLLTAFLDPNVVAAFGRHVPMPGVKNWVQKEYKTTFPNIGLPRVSFSLVFGAMRRSVWEKRPFSTSANGSLDVEWGNWARKEGYVIEYVPDASVLHSHNYSFRELLQGHFVEGDADHFNLSSTANLFQKALRLVDVGWKELLYAMGKGVKYLSIRRWINQRKPRLINALNREIRHQMNASARPVLKKNANEPPHFIRHVHPN